MGKSAASGKPVYVLNGPNLNLLGTREPGLYGRETLGDVERRCRTRAEKLGLSIVFRQTNAEGDLVGWIQEAGQEGSAIIINAAAYTHTSVAIHDALKATDLPVIEVHLSNIYQREPFRHHSFVSPIARAVICGFGALGYELALEGLSDLARAERGK
jgi:3-dehydroquinate dehydratase II